MMVGMKSLLEAGMQGGGNNNVTLRGCLWCCCIEGRDQSCKVPEIR